VTFSGWWVHVTLGKGRMYVTSNWGIKRSLWITWTVVIEGLVGSCLETVTADHEGSEKSVFVSASKMVMIIFSTVAGVTYKWWTPTSYKRSFGAPLNCIAGVYSFTAGEVELYLRFITRRKGGAHLRPSMLQWVGFFWFEKSHNSSLSSGEFGWGWLDRRYYNWATLKFPPVDMNHEILVD